MVFSPTSSTFCKHTYSIVSCNIYISIVIYFPTILCSHTYCIVVIFYIRGTNIYSPCIVYFSC